ncbi:MAG TPA: hypothetical protein VHO50_12575 [Bacteroidales bacterium]|nr:hypothetical protein [Bacteroidales bacterium]
MKKLSLLTAIILLLQTGLHSQNVDDALRYSQIFYSGTARFNSMGGAFTAIGGDISTLSQNPAGLGFFRSSEFTITPHLMHNKTDALFHGNKSDFIYNFNLGQVGFVSNLLSNESGLVSFNFGYSFNKTNNLNQSVRIQGNNPTSSMTDFWANSSYGTYFDDLENAQDLAYGTWLIDTLTGSGGIEYGTVYSNYGDNPPSRYGQNLRRIISNEGFTAEHAISFGGNYSNKIYFGATIGINTIDYTGHYEHMESTTEDLPSDFRNFTYADHFENKGTGYNIKFGAIIRPIEMVRIGLAFHSPTWYRIHEYFNQDIVSNFAGGDRYNAAIDPARYDYGLTTPFRALAGAAVQVGKLAILSADYEFVDYSMAKFRNIGDDYNYNQVKNPEIRNSLKAVHNIRLGGELRFSKLYLRGGYGYYGKAFQADEDNSNLKYDVISAGLGFREKKVSIDFGFSNTRYDQTYFLYPLDATYEPAAALLSSNKNQFTLTLGYKFGY